MLLQHFWNLALSFEHSESWIRLASLSNLILNLKHQFLCQKVSLEPKSKLVTTCGQYSEPPDLLPAAVERIWKAQGWGVNSIQESHPEWQDGRHARPNPRAVPQRALCSSQQAWLPWSPLLRSTSPYSTKDCWAMANLLVWTSPWDTRTTLVQAGKRRVLSSNWRDSRKTPSQGVGLALRQDYFENTETA